MQLVKKCFDTANNLSHVSVWSGQRPPMFIKCKWTRGSRYFAQEISFEVFWGDFFCHRCLQASLPLALLISFTPSIRPPQPISANPSLITLPSVCTKMGLLPARIYFPLIFSSPPRESRLRPHSPAVCWPTVCTSKVIQLLFEADIVLPGDSQQGKTLHWATWS